MALQTQNQLMQADTQSLQQSPRYQRKSVSALFCHYRFLPSYTNNFDCISVWHLVHSQMLKKRNIIYSQKQGSLVLTAECRSPQIIDDPSSISRLINLQTQANEDKDLQIYPTNVRSIDYYSILAKAYLMVSNSLTLES